MDTELNSAKRFHALAEELVAAKTLAFPQLINGIPHAIVPDGYSLESLERTLHMPARNRGNFSVLDAAGFANAVDLVRKDGGHRMPIFFQRSGTSAEIVAVPNFTTWRDLTVTLNLSFSQPFKEWLGKNKVPITQRQFAMFLEERTHHVLKPEGSALLLLSRNFKAHKTVRYQSVVELSNGDTSLEFIESTEAGTTAAKRSMKVPDRITLGMPVWHGGEPVKFEARFAYSINDEGKLAMSFEILNLEELLSDELAKIVKAIAKSHPNSVVIEGSNSPVPALK